MQQSITFTQQRTMQPALLLAGVLLVLLAWPATAAATPPVTPAPTLIVEYRPAAVARAVATSGSSSSAAAAAASTAAAASAADRGVQDPAKRAAIAALASEAAATIPALALMTSSLAAAACSESGVQVVEQKNYATVFQGAALTTRSSDEAALLHQRLEQDPAVQRVWYAGTRHLVQPILHDSPPAAAVSTAAAAAAAPLTAISGNAVATGLTAAQQRVRQLAAGGGAAPLICVIDTGINHKLDVFGACTGINAPQGRCRVVTGYNFVGEKYNGTQEGPPPVRGGEPLDCMGHGTMVASVAATSNGVAPGALLGSYRVFGCKGSVTDDIIIEAIDRAVTDGCDVINLSLSSGSGYADHSVYRTVMRNALRKGALVVKAAGNSGADGPFTADVYTAVGAIAAASVGDEATGEDLDAKLVPSGFSSLGPAASLELMPHVSAPGAQLRVHTQDGYTMRVSGTSFSSPYVAGVLALWLQHKTAQAAAANQTLSPRLISQAAAMAGLVTTAKPVPDELQAAMFVEPVAKVGAGVIQVDALLRNQLEVSPLMLALPSALGSSSYTTNITLQWQGAPSAAGKVAYKLLHVPSAVITVSNGWYGTDAAVEKVYAAARVSFKPDSVAINTKRGAKPATVQVTFSLPDSLSSRPLLYSGAIRLVPAAVSGTAAADAPPPIGVPYQGFSQQWSDLRVLAAPRPHLNAGYARVLTETANVLCYAPHSRPVFVNAIMDSEAPVPGVCSGGFARSAHDTLEVSLAVLKASPECSLRITLAPEVPLHRLLVDVHDASSSASRPRAQRLGSLPPLDTSSGSSLAAPGKVWSFCLRWNGTYTDAASRQLRQLTPGGVYRLTARLEGPLAAVDAARGARPLCTTVQISGRLAVTR